MEAGKIVIIEDEQEISELIQSQISNLGLINVAFYDGKKALDYIQSPEAKNIHIFILDRMLPSLSGMEICKFIRQTPMVSDIPILMLTALSTPEQIVEGLDAGADDYMTKPFDHNILMARVRSLLRRRQLSARQNEETSILKQHGVVVDLDQCRAYIDDVPLDLTPSEYKLLCCFLKTPGKVLTRNQLVEYIQDGPIHVTDRTIDTHIFGLRKKLGNYSSLIETIRGIGYRVSND